MISVALASFNGEKYIKEQIESILKQLGSGDELIVSDNNSSDNTVNIIKEFNDDRIKIFICEKKGVVANFENALNNASGDIIFLSDQDDVWFLDKVATIAPLFEFSKPQLVMSDAVYTDSMLNPLDREKHHCVMDRPGYFKNLLSASYCGMCFAFNRAFLLEFLPFPKKIPLHDWYIGLLAEKRKYNFIRLEKCLAYYRRHESAVTGADKNSFFKKISMRINLVRGVNQAVRRIKRNEKHALKVSKK